MLLWHCRSCYSQSTDGDFVTSNQLTDWLADMSLAVRKSTEISFYCFPLHFVLILVFTKHILLVAVEITGFRRIG